MIDVDATNKLKECMLCHCQYSLDKTLVMVHNIMQKSINFKSIAIVYIRKSAYRIYFLGMSKCEAKKLMNNTNLSNKKGIL